MLQDRIKTSKELLVEFEEKNLNIKGEKLNFIGTLGKDVYNITAPFEDEGELIIAGRVESRDSEISEVIFFKYENGNWIKRKNTITLSLQDPFVATINGELILGGVEIYPHLTIENTLGYRTAFYRGDTINGLKKFTQGPEMMKDIRLVEFPDGKIAVFTRPQVDISGKKNIGFITINNLDELNAEVIEKAVYIKNQFIDDEWGGANELHILENGLIGVLGHIAYFDNMGNRHYYPMTFAFNMKTQEASPIKLIATRKNFPEGAYKRKDIIDVIFSGKIIRKANAKAELYCGVSDAEAYKILIDDPFLEYEGYIINNNGGKQ